MTITVGWRWGKSFKFVLMLKNRNITMRFFEEQLLLDGFYNCLKCLWLVDG